MIFLSASKSKKQKQRKKERKKLEKQRVTNKINLCKYKTITILTKCCCCYLIIIITIKYLIKSLSFSSSSI